MRAYELEESAVDELKNRLPKLKRHSYDTIDHLMQNISVKHKITGKKLHDMFVKKYGHTPDTWIKKIKNKLGEEDVTESEHAHYRNYSTSDLLRMIKTIKRDEIGLKIIASITSEIMRRRQGVAEGSLEEVSQQTLQSYRKKASAQKRAADDVVSGDADDETWKKNVSLSAKRRQGIDAANKRLGVAEGFSLKKTNVDKYMEPGDPDEYTQDVNIKDTDYEIINNKTGQVVGTASWTTNDFMGPGALKITMKNGATRWLDIWASEQGNPQSAFNRFVKDPKTAKKYKEQGVAEGLPQTLRKVVPGYAKREIDKKMDAEKFGRTDVDKDANYYRYKKIQDKLKEQGMAEGSMYGDKEVSWEKGGTRAPTGAFRNPAVKKVVFSGTGDDGGKYEIIQSSPNDFMIHANGKHIDTYSSLQRAMSVLQNEVSGLKKTVDEESKGLWANIHAKRERIKHGSGEKMRKPGSKGAPTADALKKSATEGVKEAFQNDEANLFYRYDPSDGRVKQKMISNDEERQSFAKGYRGSVEQALRVHNIIRSKFDNKKFIQKQGTQWVPVYPFGKPDLSESSTKKKSNVSEGVEGPQDVQKIKDFIKWSYKTLNMQKPYPRITISKNTEVAQAGHHTGVHKGNDIWVYVGNRNLIDIFRTIFHELTHHRQMQLNMIKDGDSYPGSPIEMLADMAAGKYLKVYGKMHPEMFQ